MLAVLLQFKSIESIGERYNVESRGGGQMLRGWCGSSEERG